MSITVTITAESGVEVAKQLRGLVSGLVPNIMVPQAGVHGSVEQLVGEQNKAAAASTIEEGPTEEKPAPVVTEKPKRGKAKAEAPAEAKPAEATDDTPAFLRNKAAAPAEAVTRDDLKQLIKEQHQAHGDEHLPKILKILGEYGAKKQSEVKDEDIAAVHAKIQGLAA